MARPGALAEIGEEAFALARIGCRSEARTHALPGIRRERELGHQQEPAADVLEAPVHLPLDIRKDPIAEQAFQQAFGEQGGSLAAGMPPEPAGKMPALRSAAFQAAG